MDNIQKISDSYLCSGCGACYSICIHNAIEYKWSTMGRKYAMVNDNCVNCGLCTKVCPKINEVKRNNTPEEYYVGRSTNQAVYKNAQSGGVCTSLLLYLFDSGKIDAAVECRMSYGKTPKVAAVVVTSKEELFQGQKSCYTPVDLLSALKGTLSYKSIAVVGLPCHMQGAINLRNTTKRYSNIKYLIGLFCERTLTDTIQDTLVSYSAVDRPVKIEWKKKDFEYKGVKYDYKNAPLVITDENNNMTIMPNSVRFALKDDFTPPIAGYAQIS